MRILLVLDGLSPGGAERQMALLAGHLPQRHSIVVAALQDGPFRQVMEDLGVEVRVVDRRSRFDVSPLWRLWRLASDVRPDVVHTWGWIPTFATLAYCRMKGVPLVDGTIRGGGLSMRRSRMQKLGISVADAVVANSRAGLVAYGVDDRRGRVVHNGFDDSRLAGLPAGFREHDGPVRTVVMTGRMSPEKDWATLFDAARRLTMRVAEPNAPDDGVGWRFVCVGTGPDADVVRASASDLADAGHVIFPDVGLEVLPLVADADVAVLLTDAALAQEGCSNSIMEYMACGLPVVCTDAGGNPELVEDGRTGILVPSGDTDAVVDALRRLQADPETARAMGRAGAERIEAEFSRDRMVAGWIEVYERIAADRPAR